MTYTLVINMDDGRPLHSCEHETLVEARRELISYQVARGLHMTAKPWIEFEGVAIQYGEIMAGTQSVGGWNISYPLEVASE